MAAEKNICCCGASTWTKVIAWLQIVGNVLLLILSIVGLAGVAAVDGTTNTNIENKGYLYAALAISLVVSLLGLIMGIILLKGTNQKRVSYLKAWLIYGVISTVFSVISTILTIVGGTTGSSVGSAIFSGGLGVAVNIFTIIVVYIHMKEIKEGVFGPSYS